MSELQVQTKAYREVLGHYPTGVCVITAMLAGGRPTGLVVGSFTSISLDPPLVGFFADKRSRTWPLIAETRQFCVNVLASGQSALCRQIASPGDKFAGVEFSVSHYNLPILNGATVAIECRLASVYGTGDHWLVVGDVLGLEARGADNPLLFFRGKYGGFAELQ